MLKITMEFRKGILFIRLKGKFNQNEFPKFKRRIIDKIKKYGIRSVVFNMNDLKEIDLKGIHGILYVYELCRENRGMTLMCDLPDNLVSQKLRKNRIFKYIKVIPSELNAFEMIKI